MPLFQVGNPRRSGLINIAGFDGHAVQYLAVLTPMSDPRRSRDARSAQDTPSCARCLGEEQYGTRIIAPVWVTGAVCSDRT